MIRVALVGAAAAGSGTGLPALAQDAARESGTGTPSLLIVSPKAMMGALGEYAKLRQASLNVELTELEGMLAATPGLDDPERLKRSVYERWKASGGSLRYVLLVGDADVMPVRYMVLDRAMKEAFDYAFYPSDLYYADLARQDGSFDDWNAQKGADGDPSAFHAGYFGEVRGEKNKTDPINFDQVDYRPEVAVGRWPVGTAEEAAAVARKSLAYEHWVLGGEGKGDGGTARGFGLVASGGWIENRSAMDRIGSHLGRPWEATKLYFKDAKRDDGTPPPDEGGVVDLINRGAMLVLHSGHGTDNSWEGAIGVRSIPKLTNRDRPTVLFSAGCSTARLATLPPYEGYVDVHGAEHAGTNAGQVFTSPPPPPSPYQKGKHNPTGLGERLLLAPSGGAAAYIGCNTGSQPCGMTLLEGFVVTLGKEGGPKRLGDCWIGAVSYYYDKENLATIKPTGSWYPASIFFQGMKFMLFGDPSLPMPGAAGAN